jgi:Mg-chelatase subunit ChlD
MQNPIKLDEKEEHPPPDDKDLAQALNSHAVRAALNKVIHQDISTLDALSDESTGEPDADMQAQIDQLQNGIAQKSESSQLIDGSKAKVTIIEVTSEGQGDSPIELEAGDKAVIQRLRAAFFKSMGKQKAKRASTGTAVDVEALIQYLGDHQDADIFENEDINQGFAYSVVCDMSGSMRSSFPVVCQAVEMLKRALDFPFVLGNLWGFRGGEPIGPSAYARSNGDVWMYRYSPEVNWYTGTAPLRLFPGPSGVFQVPVQCGGITPMNSAINIATSHLWRKMPAGMAKRMFLLTDGSPVQTRVTGKSLPESLLRQFVANEIKKARHHGIEVYTVVIGENAIDDERCLQMFGQKKFWKRVGRDRIGTVLLTLVLRNFNRYLRRT